MLRERRDRLREPLVGVEPVLRLDLDDVLTGEDDVDVVAGTGLLEGDADRNGANDAQARERTTREDVRGDVRTHATLEVGPAEGLPPTHGADDDGRAVRPVLTRSTSRQSIGAPRTAHRRSTMTNASCPVRSRAPNETERDRAGVRHGLVRFRSVWASLARDSL